MSCGGDSDNYLDEPVVEAAEGFALWSHEKKGNEVK